MQFECLSDRIGTATAPRNGYFHVVESALTCVYLQLTDLGNFAV